LPAAKKSVSSSNERLTGVPVLPDYVGSILLLLGLLQFKHMFADFYMQTQKMLSGRGIYFHMGRAQHAGVHVIGSFLVFLIFHTPMWFILVICALEWFIHFNIDYCKACYSESKQLMPNMAEFWRAMGTDQALHHFTYLAMVWAWMEYTVI